MKISRRRFITSTTVGIVASGLGLTVTEKQAKAVSANDKIVVAHIGMGGMGNGHLNWFAGFPDVEIAAVCDVDSTKADAALKKLKEKHPETRAVAETDFRKLLDRKDIDAITYATPDHWHALNAILAFQAGKHVYGEKPLSYDIAEGDAMLKACHRYGRTFQLGTQIHAGDNYHRVVELIRAGVIGKVHTVRLWRTGAENNTDMPPDCDPPKTLDWDMWLGPTQWRQYNPLICSPSFRFFWDYSTGIFGDFWCHIADLAYWALDLGTPMTVKATGDVPLGHAATTPGFMDAEFEFPNLKMYWHSRIPDIKGAQGLNPGAQFVGTSGELVAGYDKRTIYIDGKEMEDVPDIPKTLPRSPGHQRNFLDCIKTGEQPESNIDYAVKMALPMHLACISYRLGRKLTWDDDKGEFTGDDAANRMRHRPYRAPWHLPG